MSKTSSWKTETPDQATFGLALKTMNISPFPFAVAYHPLNGTLNLSIKFEVLHQIQI